MGIRSSSTNTAVIGFNSLLDAWIGVVGEDRVATDAEVLTEFAANASGSDVIPIAVVRPESGHQVQRIVEIAARFKSPIYPISTGRNWGYGAATPVTRGCTVLDLSDLQSIRFIDDRLGLIELEPGVTQGMLYEFFALF